MRRNQVEVRGCCMGIPFGCGSALLFFISLGFWQVTGAAWFLFGAAIPALLGAAVSAAYYARLYSDWRRGTKTAVLSMPPATPTLPTDPMRL